MKKQFLILSTASLAIASLAVFVVSTSTVKTFADASYVGYHYSANLTGDGTGNLEFWTNCSSHEVYLSNPGGYYFQDNDIANALGVFDVNNLAYISEKKAFTSTQVRDNYEVSVDNTKDTVYKDATQYTIGACNFKSLWDDDKVYFFVEQGTATSVTLIFNGNLHALSFTDGVSEFYLDDYGSLDADVDIPVSFRVTASETLTAYGGNLTISENDNNDTSHPRNLFTAKQISDDLELTIDGVKDDAYNNTTSIYVGTDETSTTFDRGTAYMLWNNKYLYFYMEVRDINILCDSNSRYWQNTCDSVEFYLSTCQSLPTANSYWGWNSENTSNSLRPYENYCGELALWTKPGDPGNTFVGWGWMYDAVGGNWYNVPHASKVYDVGWNDKTGNSGTTYNNLDGYYTVEYKIDWVNNAGFDSFYDVENKVNQIIDFSISINDGTGSGNSGQVCTNYGCRNIDANVNQYLNYFDQLKLIA
ncbi:MAG: hypothetical protein K5765_00070 [Clostridia bacterium]|nr:hypothetical protein [Clostridia bacterium]